MLSAHCVRRGLTSSSTSRRSAGRSVLHWQAHRKTQQMRTWSSMGPTWGPLFFLCSPVGMCCCGDCAQSRCANYRFRTNVPTPATKFQEHHGRVETPHGLRRPYYYTVFHGISSIVVQTIANPHKMTPPPQTGHRCTTTKTPNQNQNHNNNNNSHHKNAFLRLPKPI